MKIFKIITLFPNLFQEFINTSIIKRAINKNKIIVEIINIRDYSDNNHQQVDDYPYGGGAGMVLKAVPLIKAIEAARKDCSNSKVVLLSPQGEFWTQEKAYKASKDSYNYIFICGHYEGIDERVMKFIDYELSIGDYIITGGELPAMIIVDSITRLIADVLNSESHINDSFNNNLLDYPSYTRPEEVLGMKVPEVLLSGHHEKILLYRKTQALINTYEKRPDLFNKYQLNNEEKIIIDNYLKNHKTNNENISERRKKCKIK